jgi:3'-phosphoadenosine 5'-phosphosulfate sulfotransferase (PAPS reductase)/FAD synthetase
MYSIYSIIRKTKEKVLTEEMKDFLESDYIHWSDMPKDDRLVVFSFGGGVDSTGMLFEFDRQGYMPDLLIFADTGGERPDIYAHIEKLNKWLKKKWGKQIIIVKNKETLYDECIRRETLPALAMGFHTCSQKHKIRPIAKYLRANGHRKIIKILGFDALEFDRARRGLTSVENKKNTEESGIDMKIWFPLIEWGKTREDLKKEINDVGFCASKSSCFFCPAMSRGEVRQLDQHYPELMEKALKMEQGAKLDAVKGLGRSWNWGKELNQMEFWTVDEMKDNPQTCGCLNW